MTSLPAAAMRGGKRHRRDHGPKSTRSRVVHKPDVRLWLRAADATHRGDQSSDVAVVQQLRATVAERGMVECAGEVDERTLRVAGDDLRRRGLLRLDRLKRVAQRLVGSDDGAEVVLAMLDRGTFDLESEPERDLASVFPGAAADSPATAAADRWAGVLTARAQRLREGVRKLHPRDLPAQR